MFFGTVQHFCFMALGFLGKYSTFAPLGDSKAHWLVKKMQCVEGLGVVGFLWVFVVVVGK